jgi:hypothetical protein
MLQQIISRLANNSSNCKTWCITITTAILVLVVGEGRFSAVYIGYIPIILFFFLNAYYLSLERDFRAQYNAFIQRLNGAEISTEDIFAIKPKVGFWHRFRVVGRAFFSLSIWPFYLLLGLSLFACAKVIGLS